jgi:hypothetical protein
MQPFFKAAVFFALCGTILFMAGVFNPPTENKGAKILEEMFGRWFLRGMLIGFGLLFFFIAWILTDPNYFFG